MRGCNKIGCLIISLVVFSFVLIHAQTEQYKFRHLTTDDGLPSNKTWVVIKDSRGFMWIGTRGGLCRYDGYDVKVFQYDSRDTTSLSDNSIIGTAKLIVEDHYGNLWIGTQQKGLNKFDPFTEDFTRYRYIHGEVNSLSNDHIRWLYLDDKDILWIGTWDGLNKYQSESNDFKIYKPYPEDSLSFNNYVTSIYEKQPGKLWVGTYKGLYEFDKENGQFEAVSFIPDSKDTSYKLHIKTIFEDIDGTILFGTQKGFLTYEEDKRILIPSYPFFNAKSRLKRIDISVNPFDGENTLWVTNGKLFKYDKKTGKRTYFLPESDDPSSILGQVIYSIYFDETGMMWIAGTRGINILNPETDHIKQYPEFADQYGRDASRFMKDSRNHFWIATAASKLIHFDQYMNPVKQYNSVPVNEKTELSTFGVRILFEDSKGNIWIGTGNKGLFVIEQGRDELLRCNLKGTGPETGPTIIYDIFEDSKGTLWIAGGGSLYYRKTLLPLTVFNNFNLESSVRIGTTISIYEDRYGWLWIGTYSQGLFCRPAEFNETDTLLNYNHEPWNNRSLSNETVWAIEEDTNGDLWFATENGLNKFLREEKAFERFFSKTERGANCIWDMTGDNRGYLWMTTEAGLIRYKPNTSGTGQTDDYEIKKILPFRDIFLKNIDKTPDGKIYLGGADFTGNGYFSFHPDSISENTRLPPVFITEFRVRSEQFGLDTSIILKKHIILKYNQNFFSFKFAALDYINPQKNHYAYYLEGLEDNWIYSGNRRLANYTGVPPGNYVFRVKGSNNDGYWNEKGTNVMITILPPLWKTWWAYLLYGLFIVGVLYFIFRYYLKRQQLLHKLALEQVQSEKLKEMDRMKSRFFANISHEFRTPLTLILGPLEKLRSKIADPDSEQDLNMMQRNASRLQNLINQLLNLSKLESGKMKLQAREENIVALVNGYTQSFESLAKQKKIDFNIKSTEEDIKLFVDKDKIEKILYNLLSNAFKFTVEGGRIEVEITPLDPPSRGDKAESQISPLEGGRGVKITISDTGLGIPSEKLEHIFDRFYQADDTYTKDQEGTGIGLALTKELVELHHGKIKVESQLGKGTIFSFFLPMGKEHLKQEEVVEPASAEASADKSVDREDPPEQIIELQDQVTLSDDETEKDDAIPLLLIVEDNDDLRAYIHSYLTNDYRIIEAIDGEMGLIKGVEKIPDLVISDVMMPKMDGIELCRKLKTDERTSHIPIILLTARASMESRIEGLETGADDFLTKPFDPDELQVRIKNLIKQREKLKEGYLNQFKLSEDKEKERILSMDDQFLLKAKSMVEQHLSDSEFNVESCAKELAMSRVQLHRKLHALLNQSSSEFIRTIRLNKAAIMLRNKSANVSEICYDVGFTNPAYFSSCFRKKFGQIPTEYANQNSRP